MTSNTATVRITVTAVNDAPVVKDLDATLAEDGSLFLDLAGQASDVDGDALSLSAGLPQNGTLARQFDGRYLYTPGANYNGADSFAFTVTDGALSASATVRLSVTAVNDAPVAANDSASVLQGQAVAINVLANDTDVDNAATSLRPVIVSQPAHGAVMVNANGTLTYTPIASYFGNDSFTYATSDGLAQSAPATVSIVVTASNHAPVFTSTPPTSIELNASTAASGDSVFLPTNQAGSITANFKVIAKEGSYANETGYYRVDDASGRIGNLRPGDAGYAQAALSASRAATLFNNGASTGASSAATLAAGQHVGFYLIQNASLSAWRANNSANSLGKSPLAFFSFQAANPDGFDHLQASFSSDNGNGKLTLQWEDTTNGGDKDFNDIVLTATGFKAVASAPVATLFTYDAKASDADGDTLTYSLTSAPQGASINAQTGVVSWSPTAVGSYGFSIAVSDGKGASTTQAFTLAVKTASPLNTAPQAKADAATVDEDNTIRINVLANDLDAEGDTLTATVLAGPSHGKLVKNADGSFNYTPDKDWYGTDSFTYLTSDGRASSSAATVTITVKPVNDAPVVSNASFNIKKDGSIKINLQGLTSDVDGDCLTICVNNPGKGTLTKNSDGTYTYKPKKGYTGGDSFSYTASDGKLTSTGTISLKVGNTGGSQEDDDDFSRSASVVVTSSAFGSGQSYNNLSKQDDQEIHYVVINSAVSAASTSASTKASAVSVNWQGGVSTQTAASLSAPAQGQSWIHDKLNQLLGNSEKDESGDLVKTTGLKVKL